MAESIKNPFTEFKAHLRSTKLVKDCRFLVQINPPSFMLSENPEKLRRLNFFCQTAALPGRNLVTGENITNSTRQFAYKQQYNPIDMGFLMSEDMFERNFFERWHNGIIHPELYWSENYYKDYVSTIDIHILSDSIEVTEDTLSQLNTGNPSDLNIPIRETYTLKDAYPLTITDIPLSTESTNTFARVNVTMSYRAYKTKSLER